MSGITLDSLDSALHSIEIKNAAGQALALDGSGYITSNINGTVEIVDGGNSITVDGTVAATQSGAWDIGTVTTLTGITNDVNIADGGNSITIDDGGGAITVDGTVAISGSVAVTATDLDIRDLVYASDSVTAHQGGTWSMTMTPDAYDIWQISNNATVGNTAVELMSTPLADRLNSIIENLGSQDVYLGPDNTVTTSTGLKLPKGSSLEMGFGATANIWAITAAGTSDVRMAEFAA